MSREAEAVCIEIARLATEAAALLGLNWRFAPAEAIVHDGFIGAGYGIPSPEAADPIRRVGRTEGGLLGQLRPPFGNTMRFRSWTQCAAPSVIRRLVALGPNAATVT